MTEEVDLHELPSRLLIEKRKYDNGEVRYFLLYKGWDGVFRGIRYYITKEEYDALLPLAKRVKWRSTLFR